ncbi:hypothetical protein GQS52_21520 [Streptomyces sp. SCUT-3]|nr:MULTISPECIES: hypothetical protein [unclassified Streptomyces]MCZ2528193.1 hypothetical protein [Streptomyces sp. HB2AG]PLW72849.1 hypothetical protein C0036_10390 [Streptomyces sp. DJ]QMV25272.1 hypothetical protein GQS52_21520 [Streptomyces sp. SCUT-3]
METKQAEETGRDARAEKKAKRLAHQIDAFAKGHGGGAEGQLAHIGRGVTRVALVGSNGEWGNLVAPSYEIAQRAVEIAGITVHEDFGGEMAARVRTGRYEWSRMAGIQVGGPSND